MPFNRQAQSMTPTANIFIFNKQPGKQCLALRLFTQFQGFNDPNLCVAAFNKNKHSVLFPNVIVYGCSIRAPFSVTGANLKIHTRNHNVFF